MVSVIDIIAIFSIMLMFVSGIKYKVFPPYVAMMLIASFYLVLRVVSFRDVPGLINFDVLFFIMGFLLMTEAVGKTKFFQREVKALLLRFSGYRFYVFFAFFFGFLSAFLTNDIAAIIGAAIIYQLVNDDDIRRNLLLLLAYSVTVGSAFSPVGNPQNMLIAIGGSLEHPFYTFAKYLSIPSLISLVILGIVFGKISKPVHLYATNNDKYSCSDLATIIIFVFTIALMVLNDLFDMIFEISLFEHISIVPLLGSALILLIRNDREEIVRDANWSLIIFFAFMFIVVKAIIMSNLVINMLMIMFLMFGRDVGIILSSLILSQFISNVPLVQLILLFFVRVGLSLTVKQAVLLAFISTIAGNILPFAAASNIIIIEESRRRHIEFETKRFIKYGLLFTSLELVIAILYISLMI